MENFNNVTNFRIVWISNYFIFFYFFKIVTVHARYVSPQTVSYDLFEAISRREGRETAFVCILNPLSSAIRSKKKTSRLRGTAMFADYPSAAKITVTCFARFLFVSIYFFPTVLCLHTLYAIYNIRRRKKETDTMLLSILWYRCYASVAVILNCRRSHRVGQILFLFIYRNLFTLL